MASVFDMVRSIQSISIFSLFCHKWKWNGFRFPFDAKTPIGYFIAFIIEIPPMFYVILSSSCYICFVAGSSYVILSFTVDIKQQLAVLNERSKTKRIDAEFNQRFFEFIQFHSVGKQLSLSSICKWFRLIQRTIDSIFRFVSEFTDAISFIYCGYFMWTILTICDTLLMLQMELVQYLNFKFIPLSKSFWWLFLFSWKLQ